MTEKMSYTKVSTGIEMVVQIVFIILKICKLGKIGAWPWWKVMLPTICSVSLCLLLCCCTVCCICCSNKIQEKKQLFNLRNQRILTILFDNSNII